MFHLRAGFLVPLLTLVSSTLPMFAATPEAPVASTVSTLLPKPAEVLDKTRLANAWFMKAWPDPGKIAPGNHPSNIWTRGVYYEGLMALYRVDPDKKFLDYAVHWGEFHKWSPRAGARGNADNQCCGQTFLDLYQLDPQPVRLAAIKANIDGMVASPAAGDWTWVDAIQMSMPVFARLGVITKDPKYFEKMHDLYVNARDQQGFYNQADGLWWRDKNFEPPHVTPDGKQSYWARGNGWVMAAMARVLDVIPADAPHREEYVKMLRDMAAALKKVQRSDGFWNPSLADPDDFGGKETSGTSLFTYAMAWGVNHQVLPRDEYLPVVAKAWNALATEALHPADGFLGYVQGTGKQPSEGQPVTYDHKPDFDDFGTGCFLLAGSEVYQLAGGQVPPPATHAP
jgi:rhamnogalacturonyl hydrolase YesR